MRPRVARSSYGHGCAAGQPPRHVMPERGEPLTGSIAISRRRALRTLAAATASVTLPSAASGAESPRTGLGLVIYCCRIRRDHLRQRDASFDLYQPENFLAHCRSLGAGGAQVRLGVLDAEAARRLRRAAEHAGLYLEAIVTLPEEDGQRERFEAEIRSAVAAGAQAARTTIIPGRRYEYFDSMEMFRRFEARGIRAAERATPIVERHRLPLAIENHKDQRDGDRVALLEKLSSEFVGACVDTGNSLALLEDPLETVRKLAPWAHSVHLKDQALQPYDEGFLLADIALGQGALDLTRMVEMLRAARPGIRFSLELITRDPLQVPCLTEKYWATFPEVPGRDLARTLRLVRQRAAPKLQSISRLSAAEQLACEDANVRQSLDFARQQLGL